MYLLLYSWATTSQPLFNVCVWEVKKTYIPYTNHHTTPFSFGWVFIFQSSLQSAVSLPQAAGLSYTSASQASQFYGVPEFMQHFVETHYFNTRDLKPQSRSQEASSCQLRLRDRGLGWQNLSAASLLQRPGCTRTKASSFFQAWVLSMNWADSRRCSSVA